MGPRLRPILRALWPGRSERVYLHIHIPRCAGSSLHAELFRCFPPRHVLECHTPLPPELKKLPRGRPAFVTGHFEFATPPDDEREYRYVILLRDPVERALSLYQYIRHTPAHRLHRLYVDSAYSVQNALADTTHSLQFRDWQIRQLLGPAAFGSEEVDESGFERAAALLARPDVFVGLTEDYASVVRVVREDLAASGWRLPAQEKTVHINNAAQAGLPIDESVARAIRDANRWDSALVEHLRVNRANYR